VAGREAALKIGTRAVISIEGKPMLATHWDGYPASLGAGMDNRKTFVIGISIIFGLSLDLVPSLFVDVPHAIRPPFESSLTLSTATAVVLK
jgi:hypothetical protein